jgi:acetoin utilization protein AcuB
MIVSMWMARDLVTVAPDDSVAAAARLLAERKVRRLPVVHQAADGLHLLGLVSAADIVHNRDAQPVPAATMVGEIMTRQPVTTAPDTPIEDAAALLREHKIGALPVLRNGLLVGLVTESDIFRAFVSIFAPGVSGARITFNVSNGEDVFALLADETRRRKIRVLSLVTSRQDEHTVCVVRVTGADVEPLIEDLYKSGHGVLSILRWKR